MSQLAPVTPITVDAWTEIPLTQGYVALIDAADYERASKHKWRTRTHKGRRYGVTTMRDASGRRVVVLLHRFIMQAEPGVRVDHWDGNGLDCRRQNLRFATSAQNNHNRRGRAASGFKGVFRHGPSWAAQITPYGKRIYLGVFGTPEEAARAYDAAAQEHYGEFAWLNFAEGRGR